MRERAISSIGVIAVGLIPAFIGGPVFALVFAALVLIGFDEFRRISANIGVRLHRGMAILLLPFGLVALIAGPVEALLASVVAALAFPLVAELCGELQPSPVALQSWAFTVAGLLYLGLPLYAAISIRGTGGDVNTGWLSSITDGLSPGWEADPRGLGWLLIAILATWFGDTGAYLVGRSIGKTPLLPAVSPKKTVEGSIGGLVGAMVAGGFGAVVFGLDVPWYLGILLGLSLGIVGQIGDLSESLLKRQARVKDSGNLIRGHGGILDRIDALIFALVTAAVLIPVLERWS